MTATDEAPPPAERGRRMEPPDAADVACALVPSALAAVLVLHELGARSLWVDEGATFSYSSQHGMALWHAITADGGNMMAYYAAIHVLMALFGSSPVVLRLPSALAIVATVPVCYALVLRLFDRRAAILAAFFVAGSVPLVYWGQMARAYAPAVLFVSASTLAFVLGLQTSRRAAWVAYCVLSLLAIYCILLTGLVVAAQYCALLLLRRRHVPLAAVTLSAVAIVTFSIPVALVALAHGTAQLAWFPATGPPLDAANQYLFRVVASAEQGGAPFGGQATLVTICMTVAWALALTLFAISFVRRRRSPETFAWGLLLACFVLPTVATYAISELVHPVLSDRYLLSVLAPASVVAGVACSRIRPAPAAWLAGLALVGLRVVQVTPTYGVPLEDWRAATTFVLTRAEAGDCASFFVADGYPVFDYYVLRSGVPPSRLPIPVLPASPWASRHPYELDPATFSRGDLAATVARCPRMWLIETHQAGERAGPGVPSYQVKKLRAHRRLTRQIRNYWKPVTERAFTGVVVELYVRRPS